MRIIKGLYKTPTYDVGTPNFIAKHIDGFNSFRRIGPKGCENNRSIILRLLSRLQHLNFPVNENHISDYISSLHEELAESTVVTHTHLIRGFFKYLNDHEIYENKVYERVMPEKAKNKQGKYNIIPQEKFLEILDNEPKTMTGYRNTAIFRLLQSTAIRIGELSELNINSFSSREIVNPTTGVLEKMYYLKFKQKGGYETERKIFPETYNAIKKYIECRGHIKPSSPLFISHAYRIYGERLSINGIQTRVIKPAFNKVGLTGKGYSAHSFRTTLACLILSTTNNKQEASDHLGHLSPETIKIYVAQIRAEQIALNQKNYEY